MGDVYVIPFIGFMVMEVIDRSRRRGSREKHIDQRVWDTIVGRSDNSFSVVSVASRDAKVKVDERLCRKNLQARHSIVGVSGGIGQERSVRIKNNIKV